MEGYKQSLYPLSESGWTGFEDLQDFFIPIIIVRVSDSVIHQINLKINAKIFYSGLRRASQINHFHSV